jgi:hypothetical protein
MGPAVGLLCLGILMGLWGWGMILFQADPVGLEFRDRTELPWPKSEFLRTVSASGVPWLLLGIAFCVGVLTWSIGRKRIARD